MPRRSAGDDEGADHVDVQNPPEQVDGRIENVPINGDSGRIDDPRYRPELVLDRGQLALDRGLVRHVDLRDPDAGLTAEILPNGLQRLVADVQNSQLPA